MSTQKCAPGGYGKSSRFTRHVKPISPVAHARTPALGQDALGPEEQAEGGAAAKAVERLGDGLQLRIAGGHVAGEEGEDADQATYRTFLSSS